ncbi:hypothetical protein D6D01_03099 [Aureobasidium pullulans]|uniref:Uncharacterized protein n=1 Tax=Aureobasidium pullulans TaxID=5580 RepID=A0A4S9LM55_AURPU|nr:hypothetical protein D6D01_03099 [Aureobasidium pullulans]
MLSEPYEPNSNIYIVVIISKSHISVLRIERWQISRNKEQPKLATDAALRKQSALAATHAQSASSRTLSVILDCESLSAEPELTQSSYVRTLEGQHFKLVAGLQRMYTMLLAAGAWPGPPLVKHRGNPLVHDMLTTLGFMERDECSDNDFNFDLVESDEPKAQSDADTTSVLGSTDHSNSEAQSLRDLVSLTSISLAEETSENHPQEICTVTEEPSPIQGQQVEEHPIPPAQLDHLESPIDTTCQSDGSWLPQLLPPDFVLRPSKRMIDVLSRAKCSQSSIEAMDWYPVDDSASWWYGNITATQQGAYPGVALESIGPPVETGIATDEVLTSSTIYQDSYLLDPGQYGSDFDIF